MINLVKVEEDLTGQIFARLKVLKQAEDHIREDGTHLAKWVCECSCEEHNIVEVLGQSLKSGATQSCGCLHIEQLKDAKQYKINIIGVILCQKNL